MTTTPAPSTVLSLRVHRAAFETYLACRDPSPPGRGGRLDQAGRQVCAEQRPHTGGRARLRVPHHPGDCVSRSSTLATGMRAALNRWRAKLWTLVGLSASGEN
ncbi:hypothetical protein [Kitasatospora sp. NPDC088346]|uniref:hypothetical protein n=1 Tax=Kitasatospora sp. NPDC088346 TaxID=3364073 RepID=UPI003829751A